ncbi:MAG: hypothetical protein U1U88_001834 [Lawsonella clevelandensis]
MLAPASAPSSASRSSGVILLKFEWKGIFVALAAFAALMAICSFTIEESREKSRHALTRWALSSPPSALRCWYWDLSKPRQQAGHPGIIVCFIAAIAFIGGFIAWQLKCDHPLLDVRLFANRGFWLRLPIPPRAVRRHLRRLLPTGPVHAARPGVQPHQILRLPWHRWFRPASSSPSSPSGPPARSAKSGYSSSETLSWQLLFS